MIFGDIWSYLGIVTVTYSLSFGEAASSQKHTKQHPPTDRYDTASDQYDKSSQKVEFDPPLAPLVASFGWVSGGTDPKPCLEGSIRWRWRVPPRSGC